MGGKDINNFRKIKQQRRLQEAQQLTPGQRIEEAVELSEIAFEIHKAFKKNADARIAERSHSVS